MAWSKESRHSRGYGKSWTKLRLRILKRDNYLCQCDQCKGGRADGGRLTAANEVDHIIPKARGGTDDPANLQAINSDCHKRKTTEENGGQPRQRVTIGPDGYPVAPDGIHTP